MGLIALSDLRYHTFRWMVEIHSPERKVASPVSQSLPSGVWREPPRGLGGRIVPRSVGEAGADVITELLQRRRQRCSTWPVVHVVDGEGRLLGTASGSPAAERSGETADRRVRAQHGAN